MKRLDIEWRHYSMAGKTCDRCAETGITLSGLLPQLRQELVPLGVEVVFTETELPAEDLPESNLILFNGTPLEELLEGSRASNSPCPSCSCLTGTDDVCRTVQYHGRSYEDIPEELIRKAAYRAVEAIKEEGNNRC